MHKANLGLILFLGILILSSLIFYNSYFKDTNGKFFKSSYSYRGVKLIPENAPPLSNLFNSVNNDSHNTFTSASECLKCHNIGMKSRGRQAPQIAHNVLEYCVSCHTLANNEKK